MPRLAQDQYDIPLPPIPDRFGEGNFRRFETVLAEFVRRYPEPLSFRPAGITQTTAVARLRDAVRAFLHPQNNWVSSVDTTALMAYWPSVTVSPQPDGTVLISQPSLQKNYAKQSEVSGIDELVTADGSNKEILTSIFVLKHHNILISPVTVMNAEVDDLVDLQMRYPNAAYVVNNDGSTTIV